MVKSKKLVLVEHLKSSPEKENSSRPSILNRSFKYTHSSKTDIRETFKRFGWEFSRAREEE